MRDASYIFGYKHTGTLKILEPKVFWPTKKKFFNDANLRIILHCGQNSFQRRDHTARM